MARLLASQTLFSAAFFSVAVVVIVVAVFFPSNHVRSLIAIQFRRSSYGIICVPYIYYLLDISCQWVRMDCVILVLFKNKWL